MADYIYLLENRLSPAQRLGLRAVREITRENGLTLFLVGGAVRDLTSGSPVRDLDVVVQGGALKLRQQLELAGATITGQSDASQALFVRFPGNVRMEIASTLSVTFPKPGKPVATPATILEDLRRRDFTANAMALSLNEGSYGLLMDPLNGVADIENRQLRLVSNYGFIEDPVRMVRAARLMARLGWTLDDKTRARYDTGKEEGYISALSEFHRGYETEEIVHEEDPLRVLTRLEAEGWMKHLAPYWTLAKVNTAELERLRDAHAQLQTQGIHPDVAAANFPLLTAKLSAKEVATLKSGFPRQGFVAEIEALEGEAKEFATQLSGKSGALPSQAWRLITSAPPEAVLWAWYSTKSPALQAKFKSFSTEWPGARQKMPYTLMQEMRILADLPGYDELLEKLFFELMDGKLGTAEEMKAFLEPYSPPAPPPPVNLRRMRVGKKEAKPSKSRAKKAVAEIEERDDEDNDGGETEAVEPIETSDEEADGGEDSVTESLSEISPMAPAVETSPAAVPMLPTRTAPLKLVIPETKPSKAAPEVKDVPVKMATAKGTVAEKPPAKASSPAKKAGAVSGLVKEAVSAPVPAKKVAPVKTGAAPVKTIVAAKKIEAGGTAKGKVAPVKKIVPVRTMPAKAIPAKAVPAKTAATKTVVAKTASAKTVPVKKSVSVKVAVTKVVPPVVKKASPGVVAKKVVAKVAAKGVKVPAKKTVPVKAAASKPVKRR